MAKSSAPIRAKVTVQAIGLKRRPSTACRVNMGRYAVMMDAAGEEDRAQHLVGRVGDFSGIGDRVSPLTLR